MNGIQSLGLWWSMVEAERELGGQPRLADEEVVLHYSGNGASHIVTVGHIRDALRNAQKKTLLDEFAKEAMGPLIEDELSSGSYQHICPASAEGIAVRAYEIARAMIAERGKR